MAIKVTVEQNGQQDLPIPNNVELRDVHDHSSAFATHVMWGYFYDHMDDVIDMMIGSMTDQELEEIVQYGNDELEIGLSREPYTADDVRPYLKSGFRAWVDAANYAWLES